MVHHSNKNFRIWLAAFAATLCHRHSWAREESNCAYGDQIHCYYHLISSQPGSFHSLKMNLRYSYPSAVYYAVFRAFSEDCAHSEVCLPVSLWMNCVLAANFLWAALVLYFPPCRWPPRPTSAAVLPMSLHSCWGFDVILIAPCRVILINIINVLKCTPVYWGKKQSFFLCSFMLYY